MERRSWFAGLMALACLFAPSVAAAQSGGFGLEGTLGYQDLGGDNFEQIGGGFAWDIMAYHLWPSGWEVGVGVGLAYPSTGATASDLKTLSLYAQPIKHFNMDGRTRPYIGAQLGYTDASFSDSSDPRHGGYGLLAIVGGFEMWFSERWAFTVSGHVGGLSGQGETTSRAGIRGGLRVLF
jgi:hypothetical protein